MAELIPDLPCIPGIVETEQHQVFTVDIPLERGTSYILDIESSPASDDPLTPLFRTAFTTSRYTGAAELASIVAASFIQECALKGALTLPVKTLDFVVPDDAAPDAHAAGAGADGHRRRDGSGAAGRRRQRRGAGAASGADVLLVEAASRAVRRRCSSMRRNSCCAHVRCPSRHRRPVPTATSFSTSARASSSISKSSRAARPSSIASSTRAEAAGC